MPLLLIRLWFRHVVNMFGYGLDCNRSCPSLNSAGNHLSEESNMFVAEKNFI
ncbi:MAG TPA: hypothetical protein VE307_03320 [Nitrososphaeraceae archaeon]|nr:hypothetical protein [Nitrososphaeraceae archaeon]